MDLSVHILDISKAGIVGSHDTVETTYAHVETSAIASITFRTATGIAASTTGGSTLPLPKSRPSMPTTTMRSGATPVSAPSA